MEIRSAIAVVGGILLPLFIGGCTSQRPPGPSCDDELYGDPGYQAPLADRFQNHCGPPLTQEQVDQLEEALGFSIPPQYASFLKKHNGPSLLHDMVIEVKHVTDEWLELTDVDVFFTLVTDERLSYQDMVDHYRQSREYLGTTDYLPIAHSDGRIQIVASLKEADYGTIYLMPLDEPETLHEVGSDFEEFLARIKPYKETDDFEEFDEIDERAPKATGGVFLAAELGDYDNVQRFLDDGGDVDIRGIDDETLLIAASRAGWPRIVELLVDRGADVSLVDADGVPALKHAVSSWCIDSVRILCEAGADPSFRLPSGDTIYKELKAPGYASATVIIILETMEQYMNIWPWG